MSIMTMKHLYLAFMFQKYIMFWVRAVAGKLEKSYSLYLSWSPLLTTRFPFPEIPKTKEIN